MNTSTLIALDADGVLLDYNEAYAVAWERAFHVKPILVDPLGYHARQRWGLPELKGNELMHFRSFFDESFWGTVPALPGAVEACKSLVHAGYTLVCVSALPAEYASARLQNLQTLGFPVDKVYATPQKGLERSPKSGTIAELSPAAFVDDYLQYLHEMPPSVHKALIVRDPSNSPNYDPEHANLADSRHENLADFAAWWLTRTRD